MRGLLPILKKSFYPSWRFKKAIFGPKLVKSGRSSSKNRGRKFDRAVTTVVNTKLPIESLIHSRHPMRRKYPLLFSKFLPFLKENDLEFVSTQQRVESPEHNLFTMVDLLTKKETTNELVVFEIKTGFQNYHHKYVTAMCHPYAYLTDSAFNQHQLQLSFTVAMVEKTLGQTVDKRLSSIVQFTENDMFIHPLTVDSRFDFLK